jgi:amino acid transporter
MVAATDFTAAPAKAQLKHGALSLIETIGQSIANIAPTLTPALNITVVAGLAGVGSWLSYLIATVGLVFVGACIASLAKRHPEAGSYFVYIGRNFGPMTGALAGWAMILAYLTTAVAVVFGFPIFLGNFLAVFKITLSFPLLVVFAVAFLGLVTYAAYRDIQMSSRVGLVMETLSIRHHHPHHRCRRRQARHGCRHHPARHRAYEVQRRDVGADIRGLQLRRI